MNINELLQLPLKNTSVDLNSLMSQEHNCFQELADEINRGEVPYFPENDRIVIKLLRHIEFAKASWEIYVLFFDDKPFMVLQYGGCYGDQHYRRFLFDRPTYVAATDFLRSIFTPDEQEPPKITFVDTMEELPLTKFLGIDVKDEIADTYYDSGVIH